MNHGASEHWTDRGRRAYMRMAKDARYRPGAPSDGLGSITVPLDHLDIEAEAASWVVDWHEEEGSRSFRIGVSTYSTMTQLIYTIEAARALCAGRSELAVDLLNLALGELGEEQS